MNPLLIPPCNAGVTRFCVLYLPVAIMIQQLLQFDFMLLLLFLLLLLLLLGC
jgi:hypothetical protein